MIPSALSYFIVSILILSLSISVPVRSRKKTQGSWFSFLALGAAVIYLLMGLRTQYEQREMVALSYAGLNSFFILFFWYFGVLLTGSKKIQFGGIKYIVACATISLPVSFASVFVKAQTLKQLLPWVTLLTGLVSFYYVIKNIYDLRQSTRSHAISRGLEYLGISTLIFGLGLFLTLLLGTGNRISWYVLNILTFAYFYFLGQNVVHNRLMDFNEALVKIALQTGLVIVISAIYLVFLLNIPLNTEFITLVVMVSSFITMLLLEPIEKFTSRWIIKTIFWSREVFSSIINDIASGLTKLPESEAAVAALICPSLESSIKIRKVEIYTYDDDRINLRSVSFDVSSPPALLPTQEHHEFIERLQYTSYLSVDEIEQEFDQLKSATALSLGGNDLLSILNSLKILDSDFALPLFVNDRLEGFITIKIKQPFYRFSDYEISILSDLALKTGAALSNIQKYIKAREKERLAVLGQMAAGLAHEIRNPLGSIKGALQLLEEDVDNPSSLEFVEIISEEVDRLTNVVNSFLDFARQGKVEFESLELISLINKVIDIYTKTNNTTTFNVVSELQKCQIKGNSDKLKQVFINLINNSLDALKEITHPTVNISLSTIITRAGKTVEIIFSDNGPGISPEQASSIFQPFFTTKPKGTGLGLSICRKIIETHDGTIVLSNTGKNFIIHLPITDSAD
ncbi:GHKL domain-containing protein [Myxococcota bacterium]|nr:GHKL domain-containing protein [Myxococcota bacterium]MBU1381577.1 GHKL domain-containing protein [Myxococcota bacterium]MBU1498859.1 GHKL domain-containing protein [Myxococcota bacterium]